jgi:SAM-dependent MidA family methyltransferase
VTSELGQLIARRIALAGPMPVSDFMAEALGHPRLGYYRKALPLGQAGDFTTAPEISQMFGELLGAWLAERWQAMGRPSPCLLVELGPGRGVLLADALRATRAVPGFHAALQIHLVEINEALRDLQRAALAGFAPMWHERLDDVPTGPILLVANEFFDALPVQQAVMCVDGWHERVVKIDDKDKLQFTNGRDPIPLFDQMLPPGARDAQIGAIFEWRADQIALELGRRVVRSEGAALVLDYGHVLSATGDTLQAVGNHQFAKPLEAPGTVDLTAHVDFKALAQAAESMDAVTHGPIEQGIFLRRLGIETRATALKKAVPRDKVADIDSALLRLTAADRTGMGRLFKAVGFAHRKLGLLPGLEP